MAVRVVRPSHWYKLKNAGDTPSHGGLPRGPAPVSPPPPTAATTVIQTSPAAPNDDGFCGIQRAGESNADAPPAPASWIKQLPTLSPPKHDRPSTPHDNDGAADQGGAVSMLDALLAKLAVAPGCNGFKCVVASHPKTCHEMYRPDHRPSTDTSLYVCTNTGHMHTRLGIAVPAQQQRHAPLTSSLMQTPHAGLLLRYIYIYRPCGPSKF